MIHVEVTHADASRLPLGAEPFKCSPELPAVLTGRTGNMDEEEVNIAVFVVARNMSYAVFGISVDCVLPIANRTHGAPVCRSFAAPSLGAPDLGSQEDILTPEVRPEHGITHQVTVAVQFRRVDVTVAGGESLEASVYAGVATELVDTEAKMGNGGI